jgi:hypothetical protein
MVGRTASLIRVLSSSVVRFCFSDHVRNVPTPAMISKPRGVKLPHFTAETLYCFRRTGSALRQELDGNKAFQVEVPGLVNHAHPATAQRLINAVM